MFCVNILLLNSFPLLREGLTMELRLPLNPWSFCLSLSSAGVNRLAPLHPPVLVSPLLCYSCSCHTEPYAASKAYFFVFCTCISFGLSPSYLTDNSYSPYRHCLLCEVSPNSDHCFPSIHLHHSKLTSIIGSFMVRYNSICTNFSH
jgi:hypothetical protein